MIDRIQFALCMGWRHRIALKKYGQDPLLQSVCILEIDPFKLKSKGIAVLAIDYDGVLAPYGETTLSKEVDKWLKSCTSALGKSRVFVLTNKPILSRIEYFSQQYSEIAIISSKQKKPYPDGILEILQLTKLSPQQVLVIDDRLLTGILAAIIAKTRALYITKPFICILKRPLQELFFMSLRAIERLFF